MSEVAVDDRKPIIPEEEVDDEFDFDLLDDDDDDPDKLNSEDYIINDKDGWCSPATFGGCNQNDFQQFILYLCLFFGNLLIVILLILSSQDAHNRFLPSASLSPDKPPSSSQIAELSCQISFVFALITCNMAFGFIMAKWVAQLHDSTRWLRAEVALNVICILFLVAVISMRIMFFFLWCDEIQDKSVCRTVPETCPDGWKDVGSCYSGLKYIHDKYEYSLEGPFRYMIASITMSCLVLFLWIAILYLVAGKFAILWQREKMFRESCLHSYSQGHVCTNCYHDAPGNAPPPIQYYGDIRALQLDGVAGGAPQYGAGPGVVEGQVTGSAAAAVEATGEPGAAACGTTADNPPASVSQTEDGSGGSVKV